MSVTEPQSPAPPVADDRDAPTAATPAGRPPRAGILRGTAVVAAIGLVVALAGLGILGLPVHTPLQDCGTSITYLLDGRVDVAGDPAHPPAGATKADVLANNAKMCRPRVADRAKVAAPLLLGGLLVVIATAGVEASVRLRTHTRTRASGPAAA